MTRNESRWILVSMIADVIGFIFIVLASLMMLLFMLGYSCYYQPLSLDRTLSLIAALAGFGFLILVINRVLYRIFSMMIKLKESKK